MTDYLSRIETKHTPEPIGAVVYGEPGSGKSSFAAEFPDPLFVIGRGDKGIKTLKSYGLVDPNLKILELNSHHELLEFLQQVVSDDVEKLPFKYLVLDQFSEFQGYLFEYVCDEEFDGDWGNQGFANYQQGYSRSVQYLVELLDLLNELRLKGVGVIILAHSIVTGFDHPELGHYDRYQIDAHDKLVKELKKWSDTMLFLDYETETVGPDKGKQGRTRAKGGRVRKLHVQQSAVFDAKNRFGLTEAILGGETAGELYSNFRDTMKAAMVAANEKSKKGSE